MVVVPITENDSVQTIEINYTPHKGADTTMRRYAAEFSDIEVETYFEWRGYFGSHSGVIDGFVEMARIGQHYVAKIAGLSTGFVAGTIVRRLMKTPFQMSSDSLYKEILQASKQRYPSFSKIVRSLNDLDGQLAEKSAIVLVHGTLSSCSAAFQELPLNAPISEVLAFEHDTFLNIRDNEMELAKLIRNHLSGVDRLLLVGHSRGGLVARAAVRRLIDTRKFKGSIEVWTFGTPHLGTPLVAAGTRILHLLCRLGSTAIIGSACLEPNLAAWAYFLQKLRKMPIGIAQMEPGSDFLEMITPPGSSDDFVTAYAGNYEIAGAGEGFGISFRNSFGRLAFDGSANDLVVPTASAAGCGSNPQLVKNCAHSSYFSKKDIQDAILKW